jgi:hypothetical protein
MNAYFSGSRLRILVMGDNLLRLFEHCEQEVMPVSHYRWPARHHCEGVEIQN